MKVFLQYQVIDACFYDWVLHGIQNKYQNKRWRFQLNGKMSQVNNNNNYYYYDAVALPLQPAVSLFKREFL